jgi:hypothetical protein
MTNKADTTNATPTNNNRKIKIYSKQRKGSANSNNNSKLSDRIQENGHSTPNVDESTIEKICNSANIRLLDEPEQRKYGEYH